MVNTESGKALIDWADQEHKGSLKAFLRDLRKDEAAYPFLEPVQWEALGLLDYP